MERKGHSLAWKSGLHPIAIVYCSLDRSVLEYAAAAFTNLPNYLANDTEKIQKRALSIIIPLLHTRSYKDALAGIARLRQRREDTCVNFFKELVLKTQSSL